MIYWFNPIERLSCKWSYDLVRSLKQTIVGQKIFIIPNSQWFKNMKSSTVKRSGQTTEKHGWLLLKSWLGQT